jgi:membrane protein DedA with SNARE-associated domain/rhodanese-related sulfurtransferase
MTEVATLLQHPALWLVALNTLLHEVGVPIPLTPTVLLAGAASAAGGDPPVLLIAVVAAAMVAGNAVWFAAGRRYGSSVLKFLCRISLSPDSCVRRTEDSFTRWGGLSLVIGRFIPGVSLVAPPVAGALGMSWLRFVGFSTASALLWALAVVGAGMLLRPQLDPLTRALPAYSSEAVATLVAVLVAYVAWRWTQRRRAARRLGVPRISVAELKTLLDSGARPVVLDVRNASMRQVDPRHIPTAIAMDAKSIEEGRVKFSRDSEIVLYCSCPREASAAHLAGVLISRGYRRARPLLGGLDAWIVSGHGVENEPPPPKRSTGVDVPARALLTDHAEP